MLSVRSIGSRPGFLSGPGTALVMGLTRPELPGERGGTVRLHLVVTTERL